MVGQATAFAPNYNKAVLAAARVFRLLDRKPLIDSRGQSGLRLVRKSSNPLFYWKSEEFATKSVVTKIFFVYFEVSNNLNVTLQSPNKINHSIVDQKNENNFPNWPSWQLSAQLLSWLDCQLLLILEVRKGRRSPLSWNSSQLSTLADKCRTELSIWHRDHSNIT